jgi:hypothetical protein
MGAFERKRESAYFVVLIVRKRRERVFTNNLRQKTSY